MLALNLDRLRKKHYSDSALLYVNIPAFRLKILEGNLVKDTFRVIVGNPASPTPILSGRMQRIIANPMWYVPRSITMNEILPKIKSDSNYLARNNFRLLDKNNNLVNAQDINLSQISDKDFDYTVRQNRGSDNSLGQVKFIFSNPYAVYLHDTPGKALFSKDLRAFSHGCVRVQQPERLANYILREINSDTTDFAQLMQKGQHREFNISEPLSIHITYITCEADDSGSVFFYKDIYGIDKKELDDLSTYMGI
jgi:murein L,D-transpeptidase YcbB/YkuD